MSTVGADRPTRKKLRVALKLLISVVALGFAFHDTDFPSLARVGLSADWVLLLAAVLLTVVSVGALSVRWGRYSCHLSRPPPLS